MGHALELDPGLRASGDEEFDQVGIKTREGTRSAVDNGCGTARTRRDVGELEGDEAATVADKVTDIGPLARCVPVQDPLAKTSRPGACPPSVEACLS